MNGTEYSHFVQSVHIPTGTRLLQTPAHHGGYAGKLIDYVYYWYLLVLEIVKRSDDQKGFRIVPRRWVVERTLGWLMNYSRLCRNYECWAETSEAMVKTAMIHVMLCRLA